MKGHEFHKRPIGRGHQTKHLRHHIAWIGLRVVASCLPPLTYYAQVDQINVSSSETDCAIAIAFICSVDFLNFVHSFVHSFVQFKRKSYIRTIDLHSKASKADSGSLNKEAAGKDLKIPLKFPLPFSSSA